MNIITAKRQAVLFIFLLVCIGVVTISANATESSTVLKGRSMEGNAYAVLMENGDFVFFRSYSEYTDGTGHYVDIKGNEYDGMLYSGIETLSATEIAGIPWQTQATEIKKVYVADEQSIAPVNLAFWFYDCGYVTEISLKGMNTRNVTSMDRTFTNCYNVNEIDLSGFITKQIQSLQSCFFNNNRLTQIIGIENLEFENNKSFFSMFYKCSSLTGLDLSSIGNTEATTMKRMFYGCANLRNLQISNLKTGKVRSFEQMFYGCDLLETINVDGFDTTLGTTFLEMFYGCRSTTALNLEHFSINENAVMNGFFEGCSSLTQISLGENFRFKTAVLREGIWENISNPVVPAKTDKELISEYDIWSSRMKGVWQRTQDVERSMDGTAYAVLTSDGDLIFFRSTNTYSAGTGQTVVDIRGNSYTGQVYTGIETTNTTGTSNCKWYGQRATIKTVRVADGQKIYPTNMTYWFASCSVLETVDLHGFDTSRVQNFSYMFYGKQSNGAQSVQTIYGAETLDTSNVTNMSYMFREATKLAFIDLSTWNVSNVTNMAETFAKCSALKHLDIGDWDVSNVTTLNNTFPSCGAEYLPIERWNVSKVTDLNQTFQNIKNMALPVQNWDVSNVTSMYATFANSKVYDLPIELWNVSNVTVMQSMFAETSNLSYINLSQWNVSKVTNMKSMFQDTKASPKQKTIDISNWNTQSVTTMEYMFMYALCKVIGLNELNMNKVENARGMFVAATMVDTPTLDLSNWKFPNMRSDSLKGLTTALAEISGIETLDISGWDTRHLTLMAGIFNKANFQKIILGENFYFAGSNSSLFTPPSNTFYDGKWIREDEAYGPYTPAELVTAYNQDPTEMAGTWIWHAKATATIINFDANGGYTEEARITQSTTNPVTLPEASRPLYSLLGWTENQDGSGAIYEAGDEFPVTGGKTYTLYAQWSKLSQYSVKTYMQNTDLQGYTLIENTKYGAKPGDTVEVPLKEFVGFQTPAVQTITVANDDSGEVNYYYERDQYTIQYNGNGADSGEMQDQKVLGQVPDKLYDNKFKRTNYVFQNWNTQADGQGQTYGDAQAIKNLLGNGEKLQLYAQWIDVGGSTYEPTEGKYVITLQAGQTAVLPDIPAGTHYSIKEISLPGGWSQQSETGTEGYIQAVSKSTGNIRNTYKASGSASITAYVTMNPGELSQGQFTFQLLQGTTVLQTVTNGLIDEAEEILGPDGETTIANPYYGMSIISFEPIAFNTTGSTTYTIKQVIPANPDETIHYDDHVETFTVSRLDNNDGTLVCTPAYDASGPVFENGNIPVFEDPAKTGDLFVRNIVTNIENDQTDFTYTVSLKDSNGTDLTDNYKYMIVSQDNMDNHFSELITTRHESANSRTENIDALGNQLSNYGNNWTNNNIRGTGRTSAVNQAHVISFPGAEQMDVTIVYGGQSASYDYVCMWKGSYPTYTAASNYSSSETGKLGGGNHTAAANTTKRKVNGDSVTFAYRSNGSNYGDGYGYYAVVTADITGMNPDYAIDTGTLTSGSTVTIKPGQALMIHALPEGTAYDITQADMPGYELVNMTDVKGSILQASPSIAVFENVYTATGSVSIQMNKAVTNGHTPYDAYEFELRDSTNNIIQRVQNDANGNIRFAPIDYTQDDINQSYTYAVTEVIGDNPDIIYDEHIENVSVYVADAGGGSLTVTPTYAGAGLFTNTVTIKYDVSIRKTNPAGTAVTGAGLRLTGRADGAKEDIEPLTWETDGNAYVANLKPGTYTLSETQTPSDYQTATDITFILQNDGTIMTGNQQVNEINMVDNFNSRALTITNTVSGNFGNKATVFNYALEFEDSGTAPDTLHYSKGGTDGTLTKDGSGKFTFAVDHGEQLIITDMPYGAVFTVTQTSGPEYTTSWQFTDTSASTPQDVSSGSGKSAGETMSSDMTLAFGNNLQSAIPTGVSTGLSVMVFVVLAIIVAAFIFDSKRRKKVNKK